MFSNYDEYARDAVTKKEKLIEGLNSDIAIESAAVKKLEYADFVLANLRLLIFCVFIFSIWLYFKMPASMVPSIVMFFSAAAFSFAVFHHNVKLLELKSKKAGLTLLNERLERASNVRRKVMDAGWHFVKETLDHAVLRQEVQGGEISEHVINDLDYFEGPQNIFGLYNTAQTSVGIKNFYNTLKSPRIEAGEINRRQEAVAELSGLREFIDETMVSAFSLRGVKFSELVKALESDRILPHNFIFRKLIAAMGALPVLFLIAGKFEIFAVLYFFNCVMVGIFFSGCAEIKKTYLYMSLFADCFISISSSFNKNNFMSPILKSLSAAFNGAGGAGPESNDEGRGFIRKLSSISKISSYMMIPFPIMLDAIFLFDLNSCERIERKTDDIKPQMMAVTNALAELESLICLANIKIDQPEYNFAKITDLREPLIKFDGLSHPFIPFAETIANSITLDKNCKIAIITGSNMSGKSTFLKSISAAALISFCGGPARAMNSELSPFKTVTDIRVSDSITLGISHFYSELLRVKMVTDELMLSGAVLGVFDELFHGTNHRERVALCIATLEYLNKSGGRFIIATHDRELTCIAQKAGKLDIQNFHFEETVINGVDKFTYRLISGSAPGTNAIMLAERCGLPSEIHGRALELAQKS